MPLQQRRVLLGVGRRMGGSRRRRRWRRFADRGRETVRGKIYANDLSVLRQVCKSGDSIDIQIRFIMGDIFSNFFYILSISIANLYQYIYLSIYLYYLYIYIDIYLPIYT